MKLTQIVAVTAALLAGPVTAWASDHAAHRIVGDEREIVRRYETSGRNGSSSSNSRGSDVLLERVVAVRDDGVELEYDLPKNTSAPDRARQWQFPARLFKPSSGPAKLVNADEIDARIDAWIKAAGLTRASCGGWLFTWTMFKIECDPQSIIATVEGIDLRSLRAGEGEPYRDIESRVSGTLTRTQAGPRGETYTALLPIDPDAVRRTRAEGDVAVAQIMDKTLTLDDALRRRARDTISGTIAITLETDAAGTVWRRTRVTTLEAVGSDGTPESSTHTEIVTHRAASEQRP
ncbi:MAG: hypothetical protein ACAH20_15895 [Methylobacteriaceae bacterium]|nr:hypothetical protein ASF36_05575 [Methylobacterium sp. Leaf90]